MSVPVKRLVTKISKREGKAHGYESVVLRSGKPSTKMGMVDDIRNSHVDSRNHRSHYYACIMPAATIGLVVPSILAVARQQTLSRPSRCRKSIQSLRFARVIAAEFHITQAAT
jgi:hypothetical protein